jgi:hypothetical protein
MRARMLTLAVLAAVAVPALAQEGKMEKDMEALRTYCKPDIERLCQGVEPGGGRLKECLARHKEEISVGCAKALQQLKKEM